MDEDFVPAWRQLAEARVRDRVMADTARRLETPRDRLAAGHYQLMSSVSLLACRFAK